MTVITHVMTSNWGINLYRNITLNAAQKTVVIDICNSIGMLTAVHYYIDTFNLNNVPAGIYNVTINFTISSSEQVCQTYTTETAAGSFTVSSVTELTERDKRFPALFPNPAVDHIILPGLPANTAVKLTDLNGKPALMSYYSPETGIDVRTISPGVYLLFYGEAMPQKCVIAPR